MCPLLRLLRKGVTIFCLLLRQSVRLRASTKKLKKEKLGKSPLAAGKTYSSAGSSASSTTTDPPRKNSGAELPRKSSDPQLRFEPSRKTSEQLRKTSDPGGPLNGRLRFEPYISPGSSDSEDIDESVQQPSSPKVVDFKFKSKLLQSKLKKFEQRSGSDSSLSEDSNPSTPTRPPPTPPRVSSFPKPPVQPKPPRPHATGRSKSIVTDKNTKSVATHSPPRHTPSVPQITEEPPPSDSRPIPPRPTRTQIRDRTSKSPSPLPPSPRSKSPLNAVWEESGEESDSSSYGARLLSQARLKPTGKNRSQSSAALSGSLAPPLPVSSRPRGATESDASNPFNQQMADTLIKYILASNDPGLKSAIVDIVKSSPDVLRALKEE